MKSMAAKVCPPVPFVRANSTLPAAPRHGQGEDVRAARSGMAGYWPGFHTMRKRMPITDSPRMPPTIWIFFAISV